jgi:hypothetical protein
VTKIPDEAIKDLRDAIKSARTSASGFAAFADELTALDTQNRSHQGSAGAPSGPAAGERHTAAGAAAATR